MNPIHAPTQGHPHEGHPGVWLWRALATIWAWPDRAVRGEADFVASKA